jgi:hypothetical protein
LLILPEFSAKRGGVDYGKDWVRFVSWCDERKVAPIAADPNIVAEFLEAEASLGCSSIALGHRLAAIEQMHRGHQALPPLLHKDGDVIRRTLARVRFSNGVHRPLQASTNVLQNILLSVWGDSLEAVRDRALLALRIAGAFRMLELTKLSVEQMSRDGDRLEISLGGWGSRRSVRRNLLTVLDDAVVRPVTLVDLWLSGSDVRSGRLFRQVRRHRATEAPMTEHHVAKVLQDRAFAAGYDCDVMSDIKARKASVGPRTV